MDDSATSQSDSRSGPLAGITVLEMGNFIAAPSAGRLLADFGAEVIKIERPGTGDELRSWRQHGADTSLLFRVLGRNKKSVTLDLRTEQGRDIALRLARRSDVLLENFRPGTLEQWGLGPDRLHEINPELVVTRVSGYGQTGPYRDQPGFGGVAEAVGGLRHLTGYPGMPPVRVGVSLADSVAGLYAVIGTLMTLLRRHRGGSGAEIVDVALYEAVYSLTESLVPEFEAFGVERGPSGSTIPGVVPSNSYLCSDGKHIVIGGNNDGIFHRLMHLIERPDLADDPRLQDNRGRVAHVEEVDDAIEAWTGQRDLAGALDELRSASVPCGPIYTAQEIVNDPHYTARGMHEQHTVPIDDEHSTDISVPGVVPKLAGTPGGTRWLGPELGRHTAEILAGIGIEESEQDELRAAGVI
ncbi:formyl-CoA transferase [Prauserella sediminis]|uniref:Formyl-CoA transferase n=1 Tax=Prauserella sediminis TaxID=577680 RepID=A0A839XT71_9PSEU|nr:CaiB/BaiF CoA-transferase family protein [Prauserella sediminis]MBB3664624.1 formyl-CoA transferase [Prauserella sediminis]